jgi:Lon protease-like protein
MANKQVWRRIVVFTAIAVMLLSPLQMTQVHAQDAEQQTNHVYLPLHRSLDNGLTTAINMDEVEAAATESYWTAERMAAATPMDPGEVDLAQMAAASAEQGPRGPPGF